MSPSWYFSLNLLKGSQVEVTGSVAEPSKTINQTAQREVEPGKEPVLVIARSIVFQGEIFHLRDNNGFPLWRGKRQMNRERRAREGEGKGKQKRKGRH